LLKNRSVFFVMCSLALLYAGCDVRSPFQKDIKEGVIEYDVTYPDMDPNNLMAEMLPGKMVMTFKGKKVKSVLSTAAGIVEMSVIADGDKKEMISMAKIFSDRYMLRLDYQDALVFSNVLPPFDMEFTGDHMKVADARCEKVVLTFKGNKRAPYEFYYTDEIDIAEPNWYSPYREIKGVLLDYRVENYNINMRLLATNIIAREVADSEFDIDPRYRELTADEFQLLVVKNMEMFAE